MSDISAICIAVVLSVLILTLGWAALMFVLWRLVQVVAKAVDKFKLKKVDVTGRKVLIEGEDK